MKIIWTSDEIKSTVGEIAQNHLDVIPIVNSQDIDCLLSTVGLIEEWRADITGGFVIQSDGDYIAVWLTESNRPYETGAWYYPLPYYLPETETGRNLTCYWQSDNQFYMEATK